MEIGIYLDCHHIIITKHRMVTIFEATKNSLAYTQLNDGILHVIRSIVDDPEVINNLHGYNTQGKLAKIFTILLLQKM